MFWDAVSYLERVSSTQVWFCDLLGGSGTLFWLELISLLYWGKTFLSTQPKSYKLWVSFSLTGGNRHHSSLVPAQGTDRSAGFFHLFWEHEFPALQETVVLLLPLQEPAFYSMKGNINSVIWEALINFIYSSSVTLIVCSQVIKCLLILALNYLG